MKQLELILVYLLKYNQVLLAIKKRGFGVGKYNGCGGKVEAGESIEEAMKRETFEEVGIDPVEFEKMASLIFNEIHNDERKIMKLHVYVCSKWIGKIAESEEMKPQWFAQDKLPLKKMWDADKYWLPIVLSGQKIEADFELNDKDIVINQNIRKVTELTS